MATIAQLAEWQRRGAQPRRSIVAVFAVDAGLGAGGGDFEDKITWLRQILDWQKETHNGTEFVETLKVDLFSDEVYVFTPKGDVKTLPAGSTPIDFA